MPFNCLNTDIIVVISDPQRAYTPQSSQSKPKHPQFVSSVGIEPTYSRVLPAQLLCLHHFSPLLLLLSAITSGRRWFGVQFTPIVQLEGCRWRCNTLSAPFMAYMQSNFTMYDTLICAGSCPVRRSCFGTKRCYDGGVPIVIPQMR